MSVPVAGRRKGQTLAAAASFLPTAASPSGPSWLDDPETTTAAASPTTTTVASPAMQGTAFASPPVATADPLAFLDDLGGGGAGAAGARSSVSPIAASVGGFSSVPQTSTRVASPSAPYSFGDPLFSDDNTVGGGGSGRTAMTTPASMPAFLQDDNAATMPAFLRDEQDVAQALPAAAQAVQRAAAASPSAQLPFDAGVAAADQARRAALTQELTFLDQQVAEASTRVEVLQGRSHPLASEVAELEATLAELRSKEANAVKEREERDARAQQQQREGTASPRDGYNAADSGPALQACRVECIAPFTTELERLAADAQAQRALNSSLQKELEEAMTSSPEDRWQGVALDTIQRHLQDSIRHLKQHFAQQCTSTIALSSRQFLAEAHQQRDDVFAADTARRAQKLLEHRTQREAAANQFHKECQQAFERHADSAFGALKASQDKSHRQLEHERTQRLHAFQAQLQGMADRGRAALEQQLRRRMEQEHAMAAAHRESAQKETAVRQEELAQQRRLFRQRAEAEVRALRDSHPASTAFSGAAGQSYSSPSAESVASQEGLRRDTGHLRAMLEQQALALRIKHQSLVSTASQLTSRQPAAGKALSQLSVEKATAEWHHALLSLQQSRSLLAKTVAEVKATSDGWSNNLYRGRSQVTQRREAVQAIRSEWERCIRGQLSTCLTKQSTAVPVSASLMTSSLESVCRHVVGLSETQASLRASRAAFAAHVQSWMRSLVDYRADTERGLSEVFAHAEELREKSVQAEVARLTLQSMQAQVEVLHRHVSDEATRLASQKRCVDGLIREFQGGKVPAALQLLPSSSPLPAHPLTHSLRGQSTQIFHNSPSPVDDMRMASRQKSARDSAKATEHRARGEQAASAPPPPPLPAPSPARKHHHPSSATTRSTPSNMAGKRQALNSTQQRGPAHASGSAHSASSGADLFGSDSPSPIIPSLLENSEWAVHYSTDNSGGGHVKGGGQIPARTLAAEAEQTPTHDGGGTFDGDFTTELEPFDDDEDESLLIPSLHS